MTTTATRSIYGDAIAEIQLQWTLKQIARHVGCDPGTLCRMKDDPRWMPSYRLAEAIFELRDNLATGRSKWGRMIVALRANGFSPIQIADLCGVGRQAIWQLETDPTAIPQHDTAIRLLALFRRHMNGGM